MVVSVDEKDAWREFKRLRGFKGFENAGDLENSPLLLMEYQKMVEQNCFAAGGGKFVAPAQRMVDFGLNKHSASLPVCSYQPGLHSTQLNEVLPSFIYE